MEVVTESNPFNHELLEDAWRLFCVHNRTAIATQKRFLNFRIAILFVGIVSTILVVFKSAWESHPIGLIGTDNLQIKQIFELLGGGFNWLVIIAPITVSILLAASVKLDREWIGLFCVLVRKS